MRIFRPNFDIDIINECIEEISEPIGNREQFLMECISERLAEINKIYEEEFNIELVEIEKRLNDTNLDLKKLTSMLMQVSRLSDSVHIVALELLELL